MSRQTELISYVFLGHPHRLAPELLGWMNSSRRFTDFVELYRDKIRKKIRTTLERESLLDLRAELETAYRLLEDRRLALQYEPYASEKRRGPDFAVAYRENSVFNLEVARLRGEEGISDPEGRFRVEARIVRIMLNKLGQMQAGEPNLLVIHTVEERARTIDLEMLMRDVKMRVEGRDPYFYGASRFTGPASFYHEFLHLSGILLWAPGAQLWVNKQARPTLDEAALRLVAALAAGQNEESQPSAR